MNISEYKASIIFGVVVAIFSVIFEKSWFLFPLLLFLNLLDYITGISKARYLKQENSSESFKGFLKTLCSWVIIALGFILGLSFIELGYKKNINLAFSLSIGWFILSFCILNEFRSILKNLILLDKGNKIPNWIISILELKSIIYLKEANKITNQLNSSKLKKS